MTEQGYNIQTLAKELDISAQTLGYKLNGESYFSTPQIEKITTVLHIPIKEIPAYFFAKEVPQQPTIGE